MQKVCERYAEGMRKVRELASASAKEKGERYSYEFTFVSRSAADLLPKVSEREAKGIPFALSEAEGIRKVYLRDTFRNERYEYSR